MATLTVSLTDPRLSPTQRLVLEQVRVLQEPPPRQPLPEGHRVALDEALGDDHACRGSR